jgi:phosphate:Na+ symporter
MQKRFLIPFFLLLTAYLVTISNDFKIIAAGVAIFLVGIFFIEDGFKMLAGSTLRGVLNTMTNTPARAVFSGMLATSFVQSSSLIGIITLSFLSAEIITLAQAIGIIFGSNIGTTSTSWIVAGFGIKVNIAYYAMPMIVLGSIMRLVSYRLYRGLGGVLLGLGFVFLGIGYMKEGFETLKSTIDLAQFAMPGMKGLLLYVGVGAAATVIIQSSSATMALVITAVATGQILYMNALGMAIGANIGTTITVIMGSLMTNINGKRLALAHVIFNLATASVVIILIYPLSWSVDQVAGIFSIAPDNYTLKLALFHTLFNLFGLLVMFPFAGMLIAGLQRVFIEEKEPRGKAKYLDKTVLGAWITALVAIKKETEHLYDEAQEELMHALLLHRHDVYSGKKLEGVLSVNPDEFQVDVEGFYQKRIKGLYGEIVRFATLATPQMDDEGKKRVDELKLANRDIIAALKDAREMHKNIRRYSVHENRHIKEEYGLLRLQVADVVRKIDRVRHNPDDLAAMTEIEQISAEIRVTDSIGNERIDELIRNNRIDSAMATSLINDSEYACGISRKLLEAATILWIRDKDLRDIQLEEESEQ